MKKWIISLNLLFYITFLNQWNFAESHPTSSSRAGQSAGTSRARGQTSTHKSSSTTPEIGTGTKVKPSSHPASSGSRSTPTTTTSGCTQPSRAGSTIPAKTQPAKPTSTPTSGSTTPTSQSSSGTGKSQQRQSITSTNPGNEGTLVTLDISKSKDTNQLDYKKDGNFRTYTPKPNHLFTKIVKKDLDLWTAKPEDHGLKAVLMGSKKEPKFLALLLQSGNFLLLYKSGKNRPWQDITTSRHDVNKLKFLGENDTVLTSSDYKVDLVDLLFTYTFNSGVNCNKITYDDTPVWTHTDDKSFQSLKSIALDLPSNQFSVTNTSDNKKELTTKVALDINKTESTNEFDYTDKNGVVTYTTKDNHVFDKVFKKRIIRNLVIWESKDNLYARLASIRFTKGINTLDSKSGILALLLTNNTFTLFHHFAGTWKDITSDRHDITNLKFLGENDVELKSSDYSVTIVFLSYTYLFNDGVKCKKIIYDNNMLWSHTDNSNFSEIKSFSLGLVSNNFYVINNENESKKLEFKPTPITAAVTTLESVTKPAVPTKVTLDINANHSTTEFSYSKDPAGVVTFIPNDGHVFSKVSQGTKVVWQSKDDVYGTLVRIKVSKNFKYLVVLLNNNMFTLFKLDGNNWTNITSNRHDVSKLKFFGDNDNELKSTDYSVTIVFLSYEITFNDGVKCKKITYSNNLLWRPTDDPKFGEIKSLSLGLSKDKFFVKNQFDGLKKIEKDFKHITTPASQSRSGKPANTPPSGATEPHKSSSTTPEIGTGTKVKPSSHPARSGSKSTPTTQQKGDGTQPSRTS
ncbi:SfiI-subtelomeric fragment related protein family member, putative [Theileria annulata]|uniref:SfiI-subtelomeric related protein family member, putative n=1 Tax=Theileria annulata TaxID=5874 RepID=Q4UAS3_THEAN|nr:SfiI-subtelomeric fragment related protein family member, putative [Theileria annulata]CAI76078.1 SfiI-subtelomeric fragment related protein family member, putative [Theileria annulata]